MRNSNLVVAACLTELKPEDHHNWFTEAPIRLEIGDLAGYRRICREMLARFGGADDPLIAERTAKTCALAPDAVDDFKVVQILADRAIQGNEANADYRWFLIAGAMADYRGGRFDRAVERIKKIDPRADGSRIDELAFVVRAMIDQKSGRFESARAALGSARAILERNLLNPGPLFWKEWLRCKILFREAEALILDADFPADPFQ